MWRKGEMKCSLKKEINTCPFCDLETMKCKDVTNNNCSFKKDEEYKNKYVRKERWYEKYYKK